MRMLEDLNFPRTKTRSGSGPLHQIIPEVYPLAFGGTYPSGSFAPSPKKNCSICSSMIFCELGSSGFKRYSFITILEYSSQSFHASLETFSNTRFPISPFQGTRSSPGISFPNFTQCTMRVPGFTGSLGAGVGSQLSFAMHSSHQASFSASASVRCKPVRGANPRAAIVTRSTRRKRPAFIFSLPSRERFWYFSMASPGGCTCRLSPRCSGTSAASF